ncbi:MAG: ankyrin repeat domain-containing protein [Rhodospirillaceae bacterium]
MWNHLRFVAVGLCLALAAAAPARAAIDLLVNDRLIEAAKVNDLRTAETILARNHNVDAMDENRRTALILAAARGYEDLADMLVRYRASVNAIDGFGNAALYYAAAADNVGIIEILIDADASIDIQNRRGMTPLMIAASEGHLAAVQTLLAAKADPDATDFTGRTARDWARRNNRGAVLRILDRASGTAGGQAG